MFKNLSISRFWVLLQNLILSHGSQEMETTFDFIINLSMAYRSICKNFLFLSKSVEFIAMQIRDYRTDWDLEVNQPAAGNYYPVCEHVYNISVIFIIGVQDLISPSHLPQGMLLLIL